MSSSRSQRRWVQRYIATFVACAFLAGCSGANKQLSRTDIQLAASDLRSFGASTHLLVEICSSGRGTGTFCRQQADMLSDKVDATLDQLNGIGGETEYERRQAEVSGAELREIVLRVKQSAMAEGDAADAERISSTAKNLEDSLRK